MNNVFPWNTDSFLNAEIRTEKLLNQGLNAYGLLQKCL